MKKYLWLSLIVLVSIQLKAQTNWENTNGVYSGEINSLVISSNGDQFAKVGYWDYYKFDKSQSRWQKQNLGIIGYSLYIDKNDNLFSFENKKIELIRANDTTKRIFENTSNVYKMLLTKSQEIIVLLANGKILKYDSANEDFNEIGTIIFDQDLMFINNDDNLMYLYENDLYEYSFSLDTSVLIVENIPFRSICQHKDGDYYFFKRNDSLLYRTSQNNFLNLFSISKYPLSTMISGIFNDSIFAFDNQYKYFSISYDKGFTSTIIYKGYCSYFSIDDNNIAFLSNYNSLYKTSLPQINWKENMSGITFNNMDLFWDGTGLYAYNYFGIYQYDKLQHKWNHQTDFIDPVSSVTSTSDGNFYGVGDSKIYKSIDKGKTWTILVENHYINYGFLAIDSKMNLYTDVHKGILKLNLNDLTTDIFSNELIDYEVRGISINKSDDVFVATNGSGVFVLENGDSNLIQRNSNLTNGHIRDIAFDENGNIYLGTDYGLFSSSKDKFYWNKISKINFSANLKYFNDTIIYTQGKGIYYMPIKTKEIQLLSGTEGCYFSDILLTPYNQIYAGFYNDEIKKLKYMKASGIEESIMTQTTQIEIYPNPATSNFQINSDDNIIKVSIFDLNGKEVFSNPVSGKLMCFDISNYQKGIYLIKVETDQNVFIQKFVKD